MGFHILHPWGFPYHQSRLPHVSILRHGIPHPSSLGFSLPPKPAAPCLDLETWDSTSFIPGVFPTTKAGCPMSRFRDMGFHILHPWGFPYHQSRLPHVSILRHGIPHPSSLWFSLPPKPAAPCLDFETWDSTSFIPGVFPTTKAGCPMSRFRDMGFHILHPWGFPYHQSRLPHVSILRHGIPHPSSLWFSLPPKPAAPCLDFETWDSTSFIPVVFPTTKAGCPMSRF
jgi:hypothetical protein